MGSIHVDTEQMEWGSAVPFYGPGAIHEGREIVQLKLLCDRRHEGAGITWLVRFSPPPGRLIKIIAVALSDEHVFMLEGGRSNKSGSPIKRSGGYSLNAKGQPHSAMIASEMTAIIVYVGEPDEVRSIEVVDLDAAA